MKILITGATGFIGAHLAHEARAHGHSVIATGKTNNDQELARRLQLESEGMAIRIGALEEPTFASEVVAGCDGVIHLAAAQHEANVPDEYFYRVNVEATRVLLDACVQAGVRRFVYGSTIGVYGAAGGAALNEESAAAPMNIYGITKLAAEAVVKSYGDRLDTTIIRISETYGPGDRRLLKLFQAAERGVFAIVGNGLNLRQPIHVSDLIGGLLVALQHPAAIGQTFLLAGPTPLSTREMIASVAATLGRRVWTPRIPVWPLLLLARSLEVAFEPFGVQPPLHRRRLDFFRKSFWFSTEKAKKVLGFEPTISFNAGARDTAGWYRNVGLLRPAARVQNSPYGSATAKLPTPRDVPLTSFENSRWDLSEILEYTHDAIIVWEMQGAGIVYWNRAAEQLYGFGRQEALGRTTHLLLNTKLAGGVKELEGRLSRYGVWIGNLRHRKRDGGEVVVNARLALMAQRNGRWLVLEVNRDVSSNVQMDETERTMEAHLSAMHGDDAH